MKYLTLFILLISQTALAQTVCFPTCSSVDGRMVTAAGAELSTLDEPPEFKITSPASEADLILSFFDGDNGGLWDYPPTQTVTYHLYADPDGDGTGAVLVASWTDADMLDNAWKTFMIANSPDAQTISGGDYTYRLVAFLADPTMKTWAGWKVAVFEPADLVVPAEMAFSFAAMARTVEEFLIYYPNWNLSDGLSTADLTPTTYSGTWVWAFDVPAGEDKLTIHDGDFDYGTDPTPFPIPGFHPANGGLIELDTDDPDTPPVIPPWASMLFVQPEGVATCDKSTLLLGVSETGCPADDTGNPIFNRQGNVTYMLCAPSGACYTNTNPSGNLEWEEFTIKTGVYCNTVPGLGGGVNADHCVSSIESGTWTLTINALDISNLNALRVGYDLRSVPQCP